MIPEDSTGIRDFDFAFASYDNLVRMSVGAYEINLVVELVHEGDFLCAAFDSGGPGSDFLSPARFWVEAKLKESKTNGLIISIGRLVEDLEQHLTGPEPLHA